MQEWLLEAIKQNTGFFYVHGKRVIYDKRSLGCFSHESWFREQIVWLTEWQWFDTFILIIILVNSICMAAYDFQDPQNLTTRNKMLERVGFTI